MSRPVLFYSQWPLDYHNHEALLKAQALAGAGYRVVYVVGIGIRNPGLGHLRKLADRVGRKLRPRPASGGRSPTGLGQAGLAVLPPRGPALMRRFNEAWMVRQLERSVAPFADAVAWVRWPTPELVGALRRSPPRAIVYECVDAYHLTPGIRGRLTRRFADAEESLVELADLVVVPGPALGARLERMGAARVELIPHGVDLDRFPRWGPRARRDAPVVGFAGTLDYRLDLELIRAVARARPEWRLLFVGPVQEGFDPAALADLENVSVEPPVAHDELGAWMMGLDAGFMAYRQDALYEYLNPLKALEFLAAGKPAVAPRTASLEWLGGAIAFAADADGFVAELERVIADTDRARAGELRAIAEAASWPRRLLSVQAIARRLAPPSGGGAPG